MATTCDSFSLALKNTTFHTSTVLEDAGLQITCSQIQHEECTTSPSAYIASWGALSSRLR
eukprot:scaffold8450_cov179-Ochromonas_danica.AAC.1